MHDPVRLGVRVHEGSIHLVSSPFAVRPKQLGIDSDLDLLRESGEHSMSQEDLHAPGTFYEGVSGVRRPACADEWLQPARDCVQSGCWPSTLRNWIDRRRDREINDPPEDRREDMAAEPERRRSSSIPDHEKPLDT